MNYVKIVFINLALLFFVVGCKGNPEIEEDLGEEVTATPVDGSLSIVARTMNQNIADGHVSINNFMVNISEIEIEYEEMEGEAIPDYEFERELEGDYTMILVTQGNPVEHNIGSAKFPVGTLKEIEFDIEEAEAAMGEMEGRSVYLSGTYRGRPFVWSTDDEYHLELETEDFATSPIRLTSEGKSIAIVFDMKFLEQQASKYFDEAVDADEDEILEFDDDDLEEDDILEDFLESIGIEED